VVDESDNPSEKKPLAKRGEDQISFPEILERIAPALTALSNAQVQAAQEQAKVHLAQIAANKEVALQQIGNAESENRRLSSIARLVLVLPLLMIVIAGGGYLWRNDAQFAMEVFKLVLYGGGGFAAGWGVGRSRAEKPTRNT
jgi:hypothetical protein